jgi:hypothetical protein
MGDALVQKKISMESTSTWKTRLKKSMNTITGKYLPCWGTFLHGLIGGNTLNT